MVTFYGHLLSSALHVLRLMGMAQAFNGITFMHKLQTTKSTHTHTLPPENCLLCGIWYVPLSLDPGHIKFVVMSSH